tara:strand:- start:265 stop:456 length:192 start_codon:yes stop_codon:yes gene_type:complete
MKDTKKLLYNIKQLLDEFEKMIPGIWIGGHSLQILLDRWPGFTSALEEVRQELEELTDEDTGE